jgi:hypothetical protein
MRGITWETGGTMTMTRPKYASACLMRPSRVRFQNPRVTSPGPYVAGLCVAAQGFDVIGS